MTYTNPKTRVSFSARTIKENSHFLAIVARIEGETESLIYREALPTRAKARTKAQKEMLYAYICHSNIHGV